MKIKTKKFKLESGTYLKFTMANVMREYWWAWLVPVVILLIPFVYPPAFWWCFSIALTLSILYVLFWLIQFAGATQMEQNKVLFEKLAYEIDSRQIMIMLNTRQGMPVTWDKIQKAKKTKDYFLLFISKGQLIYLPFKVFRSENEVKFMESLLKRKNLIKAEPQLEKA